MQAQTQKLDLVFAALADSTRRAILARLAKGEATVNELVEPFHLSQPTISKHLKVLENAGLVSRGREAQYRPVRLEAAPLKKAAQWIGNYERFWNESLDQLEEYVREMKAKESHENRPKQKRTRR
ncbi:MAG TPA: metalloregulator ArsR/SmtB family transcription factor [Thermoanaerobaculia bacterium]|nr:metalloregulator ArsR/SmtB family transcription factor [Thermoanaerobaculia bacterium]